LSFIISWIKLKSILLIRTIIRKFGIISKILGFYLRKHFIGDPNLVVNAFKIIFFDLNFIREPAKFVM